MISIIVPFNNTKYLQKCLENLTKIKYSDFEVLLINDFADKNPKQIILKYSNKLNLRCYTAKEKTIGVGNARNIGLEKANGEYIMFVDVDDTIDENLLTNLQEYIDEKIEMIKYKMKIINQEKEFLTDEISFDVTDGQEGFNKLCYKDKYLDSPCLYLIKKELFERINLKFKVNMYHEDFGLIPMLIVNAKSIVSLNYYGYNYFQTENSIMRNSDYSKEIKKVKDKFTHYDNLLEKLETYKLTVKTRKNILCYYTNSIIESIKNLDKKDRKKFEKEFKNKNIARNLIFFAKKIIITINMEIYFKLKKGQ